MPSPSPRDTPAPTTPEGSGPSTGHSAPSPRPQSPPRSPRPASTSSLSTSPRSSRLPSPTPGARTPFLRRLSVPTLLSAPPSARAPPVLPLPRRSSHPYLPLRPPVRPRPARSADGDSASASASFSLVSPRAASIVAVALMTSAVDRLSATDPAAARFYARQRELPALRSVLGEQFGGRHAHAGRRGRRAGPGPHPMPAPLSGLLDAPGRPTSRPHLASTRSRGPAGGSRMRMDGDRSTDAGPLLPGLAPSPALGPRKLQTWIPDSVREFIKPESLPSLPLSAAIAAPAPRPAPRPAESLRRPSGSATLDDAQLDRRARKRLKTPHLHPQPQPQPPPWPDAYIVQPGYTHAYLAPSEVASTSPSTTTMSSGVLPTAPPTGSWSATGWPACDPSTQAWPAPYYATSPGASWSRQRRGEDGWPWMQGRLGCEVEGQWPA